MPRPKYAEADFLDAALAIVAERGPSAVTVGAIADRLKAPVGSFYHRFPSRDVLLGELWLRTVLDFERGITDALDAGDGLRAALHTPEWARRHLEEARLLLLYHRSDFAQRDWPEALRGAVAAQTERMEARSARFSQVIFGRAGEDEIRRTQFLLAEVPVGAVRQHLLRGEPPPQIVDELIRTTFRAVVEAYYSRGGAEDGVNRPFTLAGDTAV